MTVLVGPAIIWRLVRSVAPLSPSWDGLQLPRDPECWIKSNRKGMNDYFGPNKTLK